MFRGFRWQFLAVLPAILIFAIALAYRGLRQTAVLESTAAKPTATSTESLSTALQQPTSSALPATPTKPLWSSDTAAFHAGYREGLVGNVLRLNPVFAHLNSVDRDISSLIFEGSVCQQRLWRSSTSVGERSRYFRRWARICADIEIGCQMAGWHRL